MMTRCVPVEGNGDEACVNCGKLGSDAVKLKNCTACRLVKYCGVDCQRAHRKLHKKACKQRVAELKDEQMYSQGLERPERDFCPICNLPIPLPTDSHSVFMACCMKQICNGCNLAAQRRGMFDCAFCRTPIARNDADSLAMIQARAAKKDPTAIHFLGKKYFFGRLGLQKDMRRAVKLWEEAAELGSTDALFELGNAYLEGEGVQQDEPMAVEFYMKAAMQGHTESRYNLGCVEGEKGSHDRAVRHWLISAKMGEEDSLENIKTAFKAGLATKEQYTEALKGYKDAVEEMKTKLHPGSSGRTPRAVVPSLPAAAFAIVPRPPRNGRLGRGAAEAGGGEASRAGTSPCSGRGTPQSSGYLPDGRQRARPRVFLPVAYRPLPSDSRAHPSTPVSRSDGGREPRSHVILGRRTSSSVAASLTPLFDLLTPERCAMGGRKCEVPLNELIGPLLGSSPPSPASPLPNEVQTPGSDRDRKKPTEAQSTSRARPSSVGSLEPTSKGPTTTSLEPTKERVRRAPSVTDTARDVTLLGQAAALLLAAAVRPRGEVAERAHLNGRTRGSAVILTSPLFLLQSSTRGPMNTPASSRRKVLGPTSSRSMEGREGSPALPGGKSADVVALSPRGVSRPSAATPPPTRLDSGRVPSCTVLRAGGAGGDAVVVVHLDRRKQPQCREWPVAHEAPRDLSAA
ncbi:hypothetical protein THAOC_37083 [Thalassiosira oceanica]|uniref:MYND-type domain-containing protein n=1 Tax=Thalassiosira oceanica TaxID=159749 RepID=K0R0P6_THAOC|nr:hypothetical protein THAOC_37083 [Thalassiosira oceanica]|eukprot:EJK44379.1 hypothetical protein THAOC_37083 [Thalassiosira oceanica]